MDSSEDLIIISFRVEELVEDEDPWLQIGLR
jgi:hypothetical protein